MKESSERTYGEFGRETRGVFVAHRYYGSMYHRLMEQCFGNTVTTEEGNGHDTSAIFIDDPSQWIFPKGYQGESNLLLHKKRMMDIQRLREMFSVSTESYYTVVCAHGTQVRYHNDALAVLQECGKIFDAACKLLVIDSYTHTRNVFGTRVEYPDRFYERAQNAMQLDPTFHILFSTAKDLGTLQQEISMNIRQLLANHSMSTASYPGFANA